MEVVSGELVSTVFDLDAFIAEAAGEPFVFAFGGEQYTLPPGIDMRATAAMTAGRLDDALRMMLGPEQWERMQASPQSFDARALQALFEAHAAHAGTTAGKSPASSRSSKSTARPSKRTSNGTTKSRSQILR